MIAIQWADLEEADTLHVINWSACVCAALGRFHNGLCDNALCIWCVCVCVCDPADIRPHHIIDARAISFLSSASVFSHPSHFHVHPPRSSYLPPSCAVLVLLTVSHSPSLLASAYSLPSFFSSLPRFDLAFPPSPRPAGSAGIEAGFVSPVSSIL